MCTSSAQTCHPKDANTILGPSVSQTVRQGCYEVWSCGKDQGTFKGDRKLETVSTLARSLDQHLSSLRAALVKGYPTGRNNNFTLCLVNRKLGHIRNSLDVQEKQDPELSRRQSSRINHLRLKTANPGVGDASLCRPPLPQSPAGLGTSILPLLGTVLCSTLTSTILSGSFRMTIPDDADRRIACTRGTEAVVRMEKTVRLVISPKPPPPLVWNGRAVIIALGASHFLTQAHKRQGTGQEPFTLGRASGRCSYTTTFPGPRPLQSWCPKHITYVRS